MCVCVCGTLCTVSHGGANRAQHRWTLTDTSVLFQPTASLSAETQYIRAPPDASADAAVTPALFFFCSFSLSYLIVLLYILGYHHIRLSQKVAAGTSRVLRSENDSPRGRASCVTWVREQFNICKTKLLFTLWHGCSSL